MKHYLLLSAALLFGITALTNCAYDNAEDLTPLGTECPTEDISYSLTIQPIIAQNCNSSSCHSGAAPADGRDYTITANVQREANLIMRSMNHEAGVFAMPKDNTQLSTCFRDQFQAWIDQGKLDN